MPAGKTRTLLPNFPLSIAKKKKNGNLKGENIGRGHSPTAEVKLREQNMQKKNEKKNYSGKLWENTRPSVYLKLAEISSRGA